MKLVVQVRLLPSPEQAAVLLATLTACNTVADAVSALAWNRRVFRAYDLQKIAYGLCKDNGLAAQASVRTIRKVADAYKLDHKTRRSFRVFAAQAFDDRCLSWQHDDTGSDKGSGGTVSIWTMSGRMKGLRFVGQAGQVTTLRKYRQGESDLLFRDGKWFLMATCDVPDRDVVEPDTNVDGRGWLGVDLGIVNIATTSDGNRYSGKALNRYRHRQQHLRAKLQAKQTKSAKRLLKKRSRKEARHATNTNHIISKMIVAEAERTGRGIVVENLTGIRVRARHRKPQRATLNTWAFAQLGAHLAYKARRAGVAFIQVDPAYTSQDCSECGHRDRKNRKVRQSLSAVAVALLRTQTTTQPLTSRNAVWTAGPESHGRTQPEPSHPVRIRAASPVRQGGVVDTGRSDADAGSSQTLNKCPAGLVNPPAGVHSREYHASLTPPAQVTAATRAAG